MNNKIYSELEDICYKYKRLEALISIITVVSESCMEIAGISSESFINALFEIELEMIKTNEIFEKLVTSGIRECAGKAVE